MSQNSNILYLNFLKKAGISFFLQNEPKSFYTQTVDKKDNTIIKNIHEIKSLLELKLLINNSNLYLTKKQYNQFILGEGSEKAKILIIGEESKEENGKIKIFVDEHKKLLYKMLKAINLDINNVYATNIISFPIDKNKIIENKDIIKWLPIIQRQIEIINPELILLMGPLAAKAILNSNLNISKLRGKWHKYRSMNIKKSIKCLVTYSPHHLISNPDRKKDAWEDLKTLEKEIHNEN